MLQLHMNSKMRERGKRLLKYKFVNFIIKYKFNNETRKQSIKIVQVESS